MEYRALGDRPPPRSCPSAVGRHPRHVTLTQCIDRVRRRTAGGQAAVFHSSLYRLFLDCHMCDTVARSIQPLPRTRRSFPLTFSLPCPPVDRRHDGEPVLSQASSGRRDGGRRTGIADLHLTSSGLVLALYEMASKGRVAYHEWSETGISPLLLPRLLSGGGHRLRSTQSQGERRRRGGRHRSAVGLSAQWTQIRPSTV